MMSLLENLAFMGFLSAILYVIYWSVREDDKAGKGGKKDKKFDINRARARAKRRHTMPRPEETSE
jgi:hypothetical protein